MFSKKYIKIICFFILFFLEQNAFCLEKSVMFSSFLKSDNGKLFVIKNEEVFIRKVIENKFEYEKPKDGCFELKNNITVCITNGVITSLEGFCQNLAIDDKIAINTFNDPFFREKNIKCNIMKFDIINKIFIKKEEINGYSAQLYLPDYYSLLRLFLYKENNEYNDTVKAFLVSDKNDIGCTPFHNYKVYNLPIEDTVIKKKRKKKISAKTKQEYLQKLSIESYKPMLLKGYVYLQPTGNYIKDVEKIVLSIENDEVTYMNSIAIDFECRKIGFYDVFIKNEAKVKK